MARFIAPILITLALSTVALLGLAPTAVATDDDCGTACLENCTFGIGTRVAASCEIGHQPYTVDSCAAVSGCGDWVLTCSAFSGPQDPRCDAHQIDSTVCTGSLTGEPPQYGLCVSTSDDDCVVWYVNDFFYTCIVERIIVQ